MSILEKKLLIEKDSQLFHEKFLWNEKYFLSSDKKERYLKLTKEQFEFYTILLPYLDGTRDKKSVEYDLRKVYGKDINIDGALRVLVKYNLLDNISKDETSRVEMDLSSNKIKEISMIEFQEKNKKILTIFFYLVLILSLICISVGSYYLFMYKMGIGEDYIFRNNNFKLKDISLQNLLLITIFGIASLVIHECGHILMAIKLDVKIKSINFVLKLGVIPAFYVKYKNLYAVNSKKKILILLSGVFMNLVQASIFWMLMCNTQSWVYGAIMTINLMNIITNLSPISTSDGYHVISILFGLEGLRWNMLKEVGRIIKRKKKNIDKKSIFFIFYFLISYGLTIKCAYDLVMMILEYFEIFTVSSEKLKMIIAAILFIDILYSVRAFMKNIKKVGE